MWVWNEDINKCDYSYSRTAKRKHIDNSIPESLYKNRDYLHQQILCLSYILNYEDIRISSAYRNEEINKYVGGSFKSAHMQCLAIDFVVDRYKDLRKAFDNIVASDIKFDQIILYDYNIHISFDARERREVIFKTQHVGKDEHKDLHAY